MIPADVRKKKAWLPDGYDSLKRATMLIPDDFDAWSSLGGVLKNVRGDFEGARQVYAHAASISDGHPYPLLNALKLEALSTGDLKLEHVREQLKTAEKLREGQTLTTPATDTPWCYFDLAEIRLYRGDGRGFLDSVKKGIESCDADWQPETFRRSLHDTLVVQGMDFAGLTEGIELLAGATASLDAG